MVHIEGSCRVCLANYFKGQSIFTPYKKKFLPHIIHALTQNLVNKDDKLPSTICFQCADQLLQADRIRKTCISSDKYLKKHNKKIFKDAKLPENIKSENIDKFASFDNNRFNYEIKDAQQDEINSKNLNESLHLYDDLQPNDTNSKILGENGNQHDPLSEVSNQEIEVFKETLESTNENAKDVDELISLIPELYVCVVCSNKYTNLESFKRHQRYHASKNVKCPICLAEISEESVKKHVFYHKEKHELMCGECSSSYENLDDLFQHVIKHSERKENEKLFSKIYRRYIYQCYLCDNKTTSLIMHRNHMQHKHNATDKRPFKCYDCGELFTARVNLMRHFDKHHNPQRDQKEKVKKFTCSICDIKFSATGSLRTHMRRHTGERPYKCDECCERFSYVAALQLHKLTHTGEKPYLCSICGKAFKQYGHLEYHQNMHSDSRPHVCNICKRAFRVKGALSTHMKIHGEKVFHCEICGRGFVMRFLLKRHMKKKHATVKESTEV